MNLIKNKIYAVCRKDNNLQNRHIFLFDIENLKLDLRTATYDEIKAVWSTEMTNYIVDEEKETKKYNPGILAEVLKEYFAQCE